MANIKGETPNNSELPEALRLDRGSTRAEEIQKQRGEAQQPPNKRPKEADRDR
jgi:hypothetical protein